MDIAPRPAALAITLLRFITGFNDLPVRLDMRLSSQISSGFGYPTRPSFAVFGVRKILDALVKESGDYFNFSFVLSIYPYLCVFL